MRSNCCVLRVGLRPEHVLPHLQDRCLLLLPRLRLVELLLRERLGLAAPDGDVMEVDDMVGLISLGQPYCSRISTHT